MKPYPAYKESGVAWIGEVPEGWEVVPVKRVMEIVNGSTPSSTTSEYWEGKVIWVTPSDISKLQKPQIFDSRRHITEEGLRSCGATLVPKGSVILTTRAPIGNVGIANVPVCTNQGCKSLVPNAIESSFLFYYLDASEIPLQKLGSGTTFLELSTDSLASFDTPLPPLPEQRAIAAYLDRKTAQIDTLIANKRRRLALLAEHRTALISHAVTRGLDPAAPLKDSGVEWIGEVPEHWESKRLKYCLELVTDKNVVKQSNKVALENIESWTGRYLETSTEFAGDGIAFKRNDLLFGKLRPYLAKVWLAEFEGNAVGDIFVYRSIEEVIPRFAFYRFISRDFIDVVNGSTFGAKMPRASSEFIGNLDFMYPPLPEQRAIAAYLDEKTAGIDRAVARTERQIALLQEYRTALISAAVTGKIDVRQEVAQ